MSEPREPDVRKLMLLAKPKNPDASAWKEWNDAIGDEPRKTWRCTECCTLQCMRFCRTCGHDAGPIGDPEP